MGTQVTAGDQIVEVNGIPAEFTSEVDSPEYKEAVIENGKPVILENGKPKEFTVVNAEEKTYKNDLHQILSGKITGEGGIAGCFDVPRKNEGGKTFAERKH